MQQVWFVMQYIGKEDFASLKLWAFLDVDENIQKIIKKTRIFNPLSFVKFECLDKFW